ncbi:hypothetical protein R1sor_010816 [Riccia sorocarpa]|uniref:Serine hydrolase domain-containing protein n=1 Tax=Riccia sorocarpa TaxID=122646 RepID=A0ABD3I2Z9_9MARC
MAGSRLICQVGFGQVVLGGKSPADLPPIRFYISISGAHLRDKGIKDVNYSGDPMEVPTLHFNGANDMLKEPSLEFLQFWKDPTELHHPSGHAVPRLDEEASSNVEAFLKRFTSPQPALVELLGAVAEK